MKKLVIFFILIALSFGCSKKEEAKKQMGEIVVPVKVAKVVKGEIAESLSLTGNVSAKREIEISPRIAERIVSLSAKEGDWVKKGDVLVTLDSAKIDFAQKQAEAELATAKANWDKIRRGARPEEIEQAKSQCEQAIANLRLAESDFARMKKLHEQKAISEKDYEAYSAKYKIAREQYNAARENLELIKKGAREEDKRIAKNQLEQAQTSLKLAIENKKDTIIHSPIDGVIADKIKEEGEVVSPGIPIYKMLDLNTVRIEVSIPDNKIGMIQCGQDAEIHLDSFPGKIFTGKITFISPNADVTSRSFKARVELDNSEHLIKEGMFARVKIILQEKSGILIVPITAITEQSSEKIVFVPEGGIAKSQIVSTGIQNENSVEIVKGVSEGEQVIIEGNYGLSEGAKVRIE